MQQARQQNELMSLIQNRESVVGLVLLATVLIMMIPLPAFALDAFLVISMAISLVIFLIAVYTKRAVDFSIFPTVLLVATLFRLALNVASTRLILTHGSSGADGAGQVIKTFGTFVIGGNYVVGIIVFTILIVINFIVITRGAGRIAEVAARFTLDGMPGKQMAIDADLNAGLINEEQARTRRKAIETEADFYGAMDGASKFVRGDAIAGIIVVLVNIIGGLVIGVAQGGMSLIDAAQTYTILTVGDGLVSQIPALIISAAAGLIVTKVSATETMSNEMAAQILRQPQAFVVSGLVLSIGALHPSMPSIPFALAAAALFYLGVKAKRIVAVDEAHQAAEDMKAAQVKAQKEKDSAPIKSELDPSRWVQPVDLLELEVGYGLVPLVDERHGGEVLKRMTHLRRQIAQEMGFVVPAIHIRDNLQLRKGEYSILVKGVRVAGGELSVDQFLAIDPGTTTERIEGLETKEPAYGLPALWITKDKKEKAQLAGYTVVDNSTTIATHLSETIKGHAFELLGRQELQKLIDSLKETHPRIVEEITTDGLSLSKIHRVLKNLLREGVPVRDLPTIIETMVDNISRVKDMDQMTEIVREALAPTITNNFSQDGKLKVIVLDPELDDSISRSLVKTEDGIQITLDPKRALQMIHQLQKICDKLSNEGTQPVVLTSPSIRPYFKKLIDRQVQNCMVISHGEVTSLSRLESLGILKSEGAQQRVSGG